jgi:hypothetical protein
MSRGSAKLFARSASTRATAWRGAWRSASRKREKEPPLVIECPPDPSELFGGWRGPEDIDVDGEDLVEPCFTEVEARHIYGFEREPP